MADVIETRGTMRVVLEPEEYPQHPRTDWDGSVCGVVTTDEGRYMPVADPAGDDRIREAFRRLDERYRFDDVERILTRYIGLLGGVAELFTPYEGPRSLWYVLPDSDAIREAGFPPDTLTPDRMRELVAEELATYRQWTEGEVYGWIVQEEVTWTTTNNKYLPPEERSEWATVDSCWGFYGREYAEEAAREALASYPETEA